MSNGKTHDRLGLLVGLIAVLGGCLVWKWDIILVFFSGWLIALFVFSPDSDLMPKKRTGILAFFLYPYALLFKHRGHSHSLIFGTMGRVLYLMVTFFIMVWILSKMGYLKINWHMWLKQLWKFIISYDLKRPEYRYMTAFYCGMVGADGVHIFLDILSSGWKKVKKELF